MGYALPRESATVMAKHWPTRRRQGICIAIFVLLGACCRANAQETPEGLTTFLKDRIGLTTKDLTDVKRGGVVAKVLRSEPQEVAVFGIVRVNAPDDFFLGCFRDIESYKKGTSVPQVKKFSTPPRIEDVHQLTIDREDFGALKNCRVGSCDVKLSAQAIARLQKEIDWNANDAYEQVKELARASLLEYVNRYLTGGNKALTEYSDKKTPLRLADEFDAILNASPYLYDYEPEFYAYLRDYPAKRMDGSKDFIYWSKEKFGLKPVISVTHVSIYRKPESGRTLIASKQIYASHYFEASLGLTAIVALSQQQEPGFYSLYLNRSRSDALHGGFGGLARSHVKRSARNGMQKNMQRIKLSIESLWGRARDGT